jgi:hypothetical protein
MGELIRENLDSIRRQVGKPMRAEYAPRPHAI